MKQNKNIPHHLAIIMDGNRRWAKEKGLSAFEGHRQGLKIVERIGEWCIKQGVKILTLYAFSTENWNRSRVEVDMLMKLFSRALNLRNSYMKNLHKNGIKLCVFGQKERLSKKLQKLITKAEESTKNNKKGILNLAISYGGRAEILEAVKKIIKKKISPKEIDEKCFEENLWTAGIPAPDLIIRTGGEMRLSGFLLWQAAYTEFYFCKRYWPAFTEKDLNQALEEYDKRKRSFGK